MVSVSNVIPGSDGNLGNKVPVKNIVKKHKKRLNGKINGNTAWSRVTFDLKKNLFDIW